MSNAVLIPVVAGEIAGQSIPTVNARDLHAFLKVGKVFAAWIKERVEEYGFIEGQDFIVFSGSGKNPKGGRPTTEYHCTLDMGKELSMVERNDRGKQARRYFIECEKRAFHPPTPPAPLTISTAQDRIFLRALVNAWALASGTAHQVLWARVQAHFSLNHIDELPLAWLPDALAFVQERIDATQPRALPPVAVRSELEAAAEEVYRAFAPEMRQVDRAKRGILRILEDVVSTIADAARKADRSDIVMDTSLAQKGLDMIHHRARLIAADVDELEAMAKHAYAGIIMHLELKANEAAMREFERGSKGQFKRPKRLFTVSW